MIEYTLRMSGAGRKCIYSANSNFHINISKGIDASAIFDKEDGAEDEKIFVKEMLNTEKWRSVL